MTVRVSLHHCGQTLYLSPGCGPPPPPFRYPSLKSRRWVLGRSFSQVLRHGFSFLTWWLPNLDASFLLTVEVFFCNPPDLLQESLGPEVSQDSSVFWGPFPPTLFALFFQPSFPFKPCSLSHHFSPLHLPFFQVF